MLLGWVITQNLFSRRVFIMTDECEMIRSEEMINIRQAVPEYEFILPSVSSSSQKNLPFILLCLDETEFPGKFVHFPSRFLGFRAGITGKSFYWSKVQAFGNIFKCQMLWLPTAFNKWKVIKYLLTLEINKHISNPGLRSRFFASPEFL